MSWDAVKLVVDVDGVFDWGRWVHVVQKVWNGGCRCKWRVRG